MSEPSTASIDREPGTARTDAERITEAGITDAIIASLREGGYGEYELREEPRLVVRQTREVVERDGERQVFLRPTDISIQLQLKRPDDRRSMARFYYEDPYPNDRHREPFFMLREDESTVRVVEPEKLPPMKIVSARLDEPQVRLITGLTREYKAELSY